MRPPRVRWTVRLMMASLAVLAVSIEVGGVGPRWRGYYRRARQQGFEVDQDLLAARRFEDLAARLGKEADDVVDPARKEALLREIKDAEYQALGFRELAEWNKKIERNDREALYRPWGRATPDPPFIAQAVPPR